MSVWLVGPLYDACFEEAKEIPVPTGLTDLRIDAVVDGDEDGEPTFYGIGRDRENIGWAPASSLEPRFGNTIDWGFKVLVMD
jgi:hypothetical protein